MTKKHLALLGAFAALVSIQPVLAVDYIACREMLRTKNELMEKGAELNVSARDVSASTEVCPYPEYLPGDPIEVLSYKRDVWLKCRADWKAAHAPKPYRMIGIHPVYSKAAYDYFLASFKVGKVMKRAQCPYE